MKQRLISKKCHLTLIPVIVTFFLFCALGAVWGGEWPKDVRVITPAPGATVHIIAVGLGKVVQKYTPIENWIVQPLGGP
jgi:hypothetical protein